jgi:hypothetical protein
MGGGPPNFFPPFLSFFTLISAHTNFHDARTTPSGRKVIWRRKKERGGGGGGEKTRNLVATSFATQPVCNAAQAAHALFSDQKEERKKKEREYWCMPSDDRMNKKFRASRNYLVTFLFLTP